MRKERPRPLLVKAVHPRSERQVQTRILVVGDVDLLNLRGHLPPRPRSVKWLDFQDITPRTLLAEKPDFVVSPLLCPSFDCLELAIILAAAGCRASYRVICENLPDPALIRREVLARCPGLDFDVITLPADQ